MEVLTSLSNFIGAALGASLGAYFTFMTKKEQRVHFILDEKFDQRKKAIKRVSYLLSERIFDQYCLFWAMEDIHSIENITENVLNRIDHASNKYRDTVRKFNIEFLYHKIEIEILFNKELADSFYISEDELRSDQPQTIYGKISQLHRKINELKSAVNNRTELNYDEKISSINANFENIHDEVYEYLSKLREHANEYNGIREGCIQDIANGNNRQKIRKLISRLKRWGMIKK